MPVSVSAGPIYHDAIGSYVPLAATLHKAGHLRLCFEKGISSEPGSRINACHAGAPAFARAHTLEFESHGHEIWHAPG